MTNRPSRRLVLAGATAVAGCSTLPSLSEPEAIVWIFDRLDDIGGEAMAQLSNLAGGQVCEKAGVVSVDRQQLADEYAELLQPGKANQPTQ